MVRRVSNIGAVVAALAVVIGLLAAGPAQAATIGGGLWLSSDWCGLRCDSVLPVSGRMHFEPGPSTGLDFPATGLLAAGMGCRFYENDCDGDVTDPYDLTGDIMDLMFLPPFWFDRLTGPVNGHMRGLLTLAGTGRYHRRTFGHTPGSFYFGVHYSGERPDYPAFQTTVPEPGSLTLLGVGLLGLAGAVRRRLVRK